MNKKQQMSIFKSVSNYDLPAHLKSPEKYYESIGTDGAYISLSNLQRRKISEEYIKNLCIYWKEHKKDMKMLHFLSSIPWVISYASPGSVDEEFIVNVMLRALSEEKNKFIIR